MIKKIAGVLMDTQLTQRQPITEHDTLLFVIVHFARHQNNFVILFVTPLPVAFHLLQIFSGMLSFG